MHQLSAFVRLVTLEAKTKCVLINKMDEIAINAKTAHWKAIVMFLILQFTNKRTTTFDLFSFFLKFYRQKICNKKPSSPLFPSLFISHMPFIPLLWWLKSLLWMGSDMLCFSKPNNSIAPRLRLMTSLVGRLTLTTY